MIVYFKRSNNNFDDILNDSSLKKFIDYKITWSNHLLIKFTYVMPNEIKTYINIKYGDDIVDRTQIVPDRTPKMYVDYIPEPRNKNKAFRVIRKK